MGSVEGYLYIWDVARLPEQISGCWQAYVVTKPGRSDWLAAPSVRCLAFEDLSLYWASDVGSARGVRSLLAQKADPDSPEKDLRVGGQLSYPLVAACMKGHVECARLLLAMKATADQCGPDGSPLIAATKKGHVACVSLLLERGADLSLRSSGKTALEHNTLILQQRGKLASNAHRQVGALLREATQRAEAKAMAAMAALLAEE